MASSVYNTQEITLQNGVEVTLRPLTIGRLRRFMKAWKKFGVPADEAEGWTEDEGFDVFINCCAVALEKELSEEVKTTFNSKKEVTTEYKEYLEEALDMDTIFIILDVCGGLKLNDPKILEAAEKAMEAGTN